MKKLVLLINVALLGLACSLQAKEDKTDTTFMKSAAQDGMTEVQVNQIAKDKVSKPDLKQFADMMVTDHTKANDELKALAASKSVVLSPDLDAKHKEMVDKFSSMKPGDDYDKAFVTEMVKAHKMAVALFESEEADAKDVDVKKFAKATLPTLKMHLKHIKTLEAAKS